MVGDRSFHRIPHDFLSLEQLQGTKRYLTQELARLIQMKSIKETILVQSWVRVRQESSWDFGHYTTSPGTKQAEGDAALSYPEETHT